MANKINVWDPLVRFFHWGLVGVMFMVFAAGYKGLSLHAAAGQLLLALIAVRIVWGFVGSYYARFSQFVRPPKVVSRYVKDIFQNKAPRYIGHNPAGGAMIIVLMIFLTVTATTGMIMYGSEEGKGPLAFMYDMPTLWYHELCEFIHIPLAYFTISMILLHVVGVLVSSWINKENLIKSMFTGRKPREMEGHPNADEPA